MSLNRLCVAISRPCSLPDGPAFPPGGCGPADRRDRLDRNAQQARTQPRAAARSAVRPPGKAYLPQLGKAYAAAWEEGAKQLEAGQSITAALEAVSKTWSANRTQLYDHVFTPEFSRIVAESVKDADVTPAERAALAAAWRGLSLGLAK